MASETPIFSSEMISLLRAGCTVPAKRAAGGLKSFAGFLFLGICEMHSARFGSPYAKVLPRNHFTLKKWGSPMPWSQPYLYAKT
jgi:hypothetical protein